MDTQLESLQYPRITISSVKEQYLGSLVPAQCALPGDGDRLVGDALVHVPISFFHVELGDPRGLDLFETVVMVADVQSLLNAVEMYRPDLVVLDLSLLSGQPADVAGKLMAIRPGLRVVVFSVHDEPSAADWCLQLGLAGFVVKRSAATDLIPAVRTVLAGGTYISSSAQHVSNGQ